MPQSPTYPPELQGIQHSTRVEALPVGGECHSIFWNGATEGETRIFKDTKDAGEFIEKHFASNDPRSNWHDDIIWEPLPETPGASALIRVLNPTPSVIYLTTGDGGLMQMFEQHDLTEYEDGFSAAAEMEHWVDSGWAFLTHDEAQAEHPDRLVHSVNDEKMTFLIYAAKDHYR